MTFMLPKSYPKNTERYGNECIYVVRAVSREAAMHLLNEVTGFEGDAWDLDVADNENGKIIE